MKKIKITKQKFALVDDEDFDLVNRYKWQYNIRYARTGIWGKGKALSIYMHRLIMRPSKNLDVDHIDGNGLNNQRKNLRVATRAENSRNRHCLISSKKGVTLDKRTNLKKRWIAQLTFNYKLIFLGRYSTLEEAQAIYNKESKKYFGKFSYST